MTLRAERLPGLSGWAPALVHGDGSAWLSLPVASGHAEFSIRLPLSAQQAEALRADPGRAWIVFGALHARLQTLGPRVGQGLAAELAAAILPQVLGAKDLPALCAGLRRDTPDFDNAIARASGGSYRAPGMDD